jgi:hypothetical protein
MFNRVPNGPRRARGDAPRFNQEDSWASNYNKSRETDWKSVLHASIWAGMRIMPYVFRYSR